jgi:iron complex outermembrane receptor protein
VEFEWAAAQGLTITPGFKTMSYNFDLNSAMNQIKNGQVPQAYAYHYSAALPFLTARQKLDDHNTVYAQYAKGMDVPFLGVGSATSGTPAPQTTTNYQVGVVHVEDRLTVDADLYYIDVNNLQQSTGTGNAIQYYNAGGAVYKGFESEGTYVLGAGFSGYAAYSLNDSNYKTTNPGLTVGQSRITGTPNMTAGLGVLYKEGPWSGSLIYKRIGEQQYSYSATGYPTLAAFNNVSLNMAYTFKEAVAGLGLKSLRAQFSVFNLTNEQNVTTATGLLSAPSTQVTYEAPRSYMMTLKGDF